MATSDTEIANMALSHLATAKTISILATERSAEANACRRFYDQSRLELLRMRWWPFASQLSTLALVDTFTIPGSPPDPTKPFAEWQYAYRYPSDCLDFRRIISGIRHGADNRQTRIPFRLGQDSEGRLIYCDLQFALAEYTVDIKDVTRFTPDFVAALSYRLASYIAPSVTAGDPFKLGSTCIQMFQMAIGVAGQAAFNEEQPDLPAESEFMRSREDTSGEWQNSWSPIIRGGS